MTRIGPWNAIPDLGNRQRAGATFTNRKRGLRATLGMIVGQVGADRDINDRLADRSYLERQDILQALGYSIWRGQGPRAALVRGRNL